MKLQDDMTKPSSMIMAAIVTLMAGVILCGSLVMIGCRTVDSSNQVDIATIAAAIKGVSRSATLYAVRKEPSSTNYLDMFSVYAQSFATNASLDPATINQLINNLPFKNRATPESQLAISTIMTAYEIYWIRHPMQPAERNKEFIKYLEALSQGVSYGIEDSRNITP